MTDNPEQKKVAIFTFKSDEERKKKIENLKQRFNQALVLRLLNLENFDDLDEDSLVTKLNNDQVLENLQQANEKMVEELGQIALVNSQRLRQTINNLQEQYNDRSENLTGDRHKRLKEIKYQKAKLRQLQEEIKAKEQAEQDEKTKKELSLLKMREEKAKAELKGMEIGEDFLAGELQKLKDQQKNLEEFSLRKEAIEQAEFIASLPKETKESLMQFAQKCNKQEDTKGLFVEALNDLQVSCIQENGEISFYPEGDKNRHSFNLTDTGKVDHRIQNLGGTGLDIGIIDNQLSLIRNQDLTSEQLRALAEYCYRNGLDISDYKDLKDLKVLEDGREVGNVKDKMEKTLAELADKERAEFNSENGKAESVATPSAPEQTGVSDDLYQFLPRIKTVDELEINRTNMIAATKSRMKLTAGMGDSESLFRITRYSNSTVISVYASENDKLADGELDKHRKRIHSKQFSVELTHDRPPTGRFYMGQTKELKADHARMLLDAFKAVGCKYFIMPNVAEIGGKMAGKAFMEASVKTGMIPYLKASKNAEGSDIGLPDLTTVFEAMEKEPDMKGDAKVEYMLRWHQELNKYCKDDLDRQSKFGTHLEKFKVGACFVKFQESYMEKLENHMQDGMKGKLEGQNEQWDGIDQITATIAMTKILNDLKEGKLNGRPFNPMDTKPPTNDQLLIDTLTQYMRDNRGKVEKEVQDKIDNEYQSVKVDSRDDKAVQGILRGYKDEYITAYSRLEGYGVKIKPVIPNALKGYRDPRPRPRSRDDDERNR